MSLKTGLITGYIAMFLVGICLGMEIQQKAEWLRNIPNILVVILATGGAVYTAQIASWLTRILEVYELKENNKKRN